MASFELILTGQVGRSKKREKVHSLKNLKKS